jgi:hypothetical protein
MHGDKSIPLSSASIRVDLRLQLFPDSPGAQSSPSGLPTVMKAINPHRGPTDSLIRLFIRVHPRPDSI